jgi:hypothetical protein
MCEKDSGMRRKNRRETNDDNCALLLVFNVFFFLFSLSLQEEKYNRRSNNLLFGVSVGDLYVYRKGERMILMKREKPGYRRRKKEI